MILYSVLFFIFFINSNKIHSALVKVDNSKTEVVYSEYQLNPDGDYYYKYKLSDGQAIAVEAKLKEVDGNQVYAVKGFYTFEGTDGRVYTVNYMADENGYNTAQENLPQSSSTPRPPASPGRPPIGPPPPIKPGESSEINPQTIAGAFG